MRRTEIVAVWTSILILSGTASAWQTPKQGGPYRPTAAERAAIADKTAELGRAVEGLAGRNGERGDDALADVVIAHKAADWALRFDDFFDARDVARALKVLGRGLERAEALGAGRVPWSDGEGGVVRGYRSRVDGSVQPYAVIVPPKTAGEGPFRLDVVLHGRDARLSEVRFFDAHDGKPAPADQAGLVLHVYGRGNNAYRWAGEADVFEAVDAVRRNYRVDDRRVVLRGFSMGGAGAWHLGLHHPGRWSSVEAGAGFTETIRYARLGDPSEATRKLLTIYDAVDYARNAFNVPIAGYGGEIDPQAQASLNILEALQAQGIDMKTEGLVTTAEGVDFRRIVGKGMGHAVDKESAKLLKAFHDDRAAKGVDPLPSRIRFVTYTLKYPQVGWLKIRRLGEHYARATLDADLIDDRATVRTANVVVLAAARRAAATISLDGRDFPLRDAAGESPDVLFRKGADGWEPLDAAQAGAIEANAGREKHPGVQGPIDDAFTGPFLCVRGTGEPANALVHAWAEARLSRFAEEWGRWMRGALPIKDDVDVTEGDFKTHNVILFGDVGSNAWIKALAPEIGLSWNATELKLRGESHPAADHAPVLIQANPRNPLRYVVVNGGHTFGDREFRGTNALLFPHLADFAVFRIGPQEEVVAEGFFDERWE
ncbi:alpha/beta hydrolase-fold protein [Planctomyces sp. SH-PL62]|uniref:alpha/beta hydrolase-fold protein n=1 Tax=Planctomyces sp. SH-PL62 TaxID=1636152 RepID=UPI00078D5781|nr:alpha/beta hydrolase-fold protein [Planctomyces sp. SH-PL62]AMV36921.1 Putative esterase [Planctomyces sp. SH-PL62]